MKLLTLTPALKELVDLTLKKSNGDDATEKATKFVETTFAIINGGVLTRQLAYRDLAHARRVRKALKALQDYKRDAEVKLEDHHYRELFGSEDQPGILRQYGGWMANEFVDEYVEIWESAKVVSAKELDKKKDKP